VSVLNTVLTAMVRAFFKQEESAVEKMKSVRSDVSAPCVTESASDVAFTLSR
jgi:hypothetical protein